MNLAIRVRRGFEPCHTPHTFPFVILSEREPSLRGERESKDLEFVSERER